MYQHKTILHRPSEQLRVFENVELPKFFYLHAIRLTIMRFCKRKTLKKKQGYLQAKKALFVQIQLEGNSKYINGSLENRNTKDFSFTIVTIYLTACSSHSQIDKNKALPIY